MSSSDSPPEPLADYEPPAPPRQSFGRFLRDVLIIGALGAGGVYWYSQYVTKREKVEELATEARSASKKNDLPSLREAEEKFRDALEIHPGSGRVAAALAETYLFLHSTHGLETLSKASQYLSKAEEEDVETPSRFAVAAYLKIERGQPEAAERMIKGLLDQDKSSPAFAHALGWAMMEQGDYIEANRLMDSAKDAEFSAVAYRVTLAESSHRQGSPKAAIKHLSAIIRPNMNPDHNLARAYLAALRLQAYGNLTTPSKLIEEFKSSKAEKSPRAQAYGHWAEAEFFLALGTSEMADKALEAIGKAKEKWPDYPPFVELEARAQLAKGNDEEAIALYEKAIAMEPLYRGIKWDLARLKSEREDDAALTLVEELEKTGLDGPEYEIFRGEHALRKGDLEAARNHFNAAAELGDDPEILLGLAKVGFEEEEKKGRRADLDRVATDLQRAMDAKKYFPEAQEFYGRLNLWNYLVDGAQGAFVEAEKQLKRLKRPIPEILAFYDRVIDRFESVKRRRLRRKTRRLARQWEQRKQQYMQSLLPS